MNVAPVVDQILQRAAGAARFVVAIAGPPGAGKSTLSDALAEALVAAGEKAAVLPMDGFHMDNAVLEQKGLLARKGAPETFDARSFLATIAAVRANDGEVLVPVFDRARELAIASARVVAADTRIILVEGNYLLLD
ncbi:MAG: nucleoside/nucleotide kinase family protein, partial [Ensifer adhaerens]